MSDQKKILVIKLSALGDFIQALGAMAAIRRHHEHAHITLMTTKPFENFARECGYFDAILIDSKPKWHQVSKWKSLRKTLNESRFERVYDLQNNDRTELYFRTLKTPRPEWVGVARGASHRNTSPKRTEGHALDGHAQTLGLVGIKNVSVDPLDWMQEDISDLGVEKSYVLLVPGSAPQHPQKRWPADRYGALATALVEQNHQPVILGTESESDLAVIIKEICPQALDLTNKTNLKQIAVLGRGAAESIGNDTGPMHLIGATGCPSLVLFSNHSDPTRHAPKGAHVQTLQEDDLSNLSVEKVVGALKIGAVKR